MAEGQADLIYQAELDNKAVLESIKEMRKEAKGFEKQGDQAMAEYGKRVDDTAKQLGSLAEMLAKGGTAGEKASAQLEKFFGTSIKSSKQFRGQLTKMLKDIEAVGEIEVGKGAIDFDKVFKGKIKGKVTREILLKVIGTEEAEQKIEQLRGITDKLMSSTEDSSKKIGTHIRALGEDLYTSFKKGGKGVDDANKELNDFITTAKKALAQTKGFEETDLEKKLKIHKAEAAMKDLNNTISKMMKSTKVEVRSAGTTFGQLRDKIKDAAKDPKADMNNLIKKTKELNREAKSLGNAYEDDVTRGTSRARVSAYKLGTTFDRIGLRGAGGILRITDAFKGIPRSTVFAIASIAAVSLAILGLVKLVVRLEKAMIRAFIDTTKKAVEVAKAFELTEKQLENVFKGKVDVARHTLEKILDLSVEYGVDLTGEVAKIFLPLVDSFEQFEELAEAVSTLAIGSGKTISEAARALKQMQAGRSRALLDMGVLASDVEKIKRLQEGMGETAGLIAGMQAFFDRSSQEWDTYENTLQRVLGSLDMLKDKLLLTFGEPIKNQIVKEIQKIIDFVEQNEEVIRSFLTSISSVVTDVIGRIGDVIKDAFEDISEKDLEDLSLAVTSVGNAVASLVETLAGTTGDEFNPLIDGAIALLETLEWALHTVEKIAQGVSDLLSLPGITVSAIFPTGPMFFEDELVEQLQMLRDHIDVSDEQIARMLLEEGMDRQVIVDSLVELNNITLDQAEEIIDTASKIPWKEFTDAIRELGGQPPLFSRLEPLFIASKLKEEEAARRANAAAVEEERDQILKANAAYQDFLVTQEKYLAQVEEVREAERALTEQLQSRFSAIFAATMASDIGDRIAEVGERIRIEQEKIANLETLEWKIINIDTMDLDAVARFGKEQIAGLQQEIDDVLEYIVNKKGQISEEELRRLQMEIDFKRRLIQLEQDHIDRIADLRTKRRDDEEDAQTDYDRREDSIRIKAARREIEMELDHSRKIERMEQSHQNRLREIRMRADFDAQEAIRMNDAVALLRIRRRMDFDIKMSEDKNKEQKQNAETDSQDRRGKLARQLQYELDDLEIAHDQKLEDIATNFKRQLILIEENYQKQLRQQADAEKAKREDMLIWLRTELTDYQSMWDDKIAAHEKNHKDFYEIELKYFKLRKALNITGAYTVGAGGQVIPNYGGGASGVGSWFGAGGQRGAPAYRGRGGSSQGVDQNLRLAVTQLLNRLISSGRISNPQFWTGEVNAATTNARLRELKNMLNTIGVSGAPMQHGGFANVGQQYRVGEMGPETYRPTKAGIIQPAQREYMPMGSPQIQNITTDNSRSVSAPISMYDPSQFSAMQVTIIQSIVTEQILKSTV